MSTAALFTAGSGPGSDNGMTDITRAQEIFGFQKKILRCGIGVAYPPSVTAGAGFMRQPSVGPCSLSKGWPGELTCCLISTVVTAR